MTPEKPTRKSGTVSLDHEVVVVDAQVTEFPWGTVFCDRPANERERVTWPRPAGATPPPEAPESKRPAE